MQADLAEMEADLTEDAIEVAPSLGSRATTRVLTRPELFHQQWHLYMLGEAPPIDERLLVRNSEPVRQRGRPRGAANFADVEPSQALDILPSSSQAEAFDRSVNREPSAFESALLSQRGRGSRRARGQGRSREGRGQGRSATTRASGASTTQDSGPAMTQDSDMSMTQDSRAVLTQAFAGTPVLPSLSQAISQAITQAYWGTQGHPTPSQAMAQPYLGTPGHPSASQPSTQPHWAPVITQDSWGTPGHGGSTWQGRQ